MLSLSPGAGVCMGGVEEELAGVEVRQLRLDLLLEPLLKVAQDKQQVA